MRRSRIFAAVIAWLCLSVAALAAGPDAVSENAIFPLSVSQDRTHLVDRDSAPFFVNGEAVWSLIAELTSKEVEDYLQDRRARGFNALLVNLIEHRFSTNAPANAYGETPFLQPGRFDLPKDAYFDRAHRIVSRARELGFAVFLLPAYLGVNGGDQGWYGEMTAAGPETLAGYATYLARRFGDLDNIVWTHGGDWDAPDSSLIDAMAQTFDTLLPEALQTVHSSRDTITAEYWRDAPWLDIDTAYTYGDTAERIAEHRADAFDLPVVLIESRYENEGETTAQSLREGAYKAIMAGAAGTFFGNNPIWHFTDEGLYAAARGWRAELSGQGSQSMTHMRRFFEALPWWRLEVDPTMTPCGAPLAISGLSCAATPDGRLAIVYMPTPRQLRISRGDLADTPFCGRWYDPRTGNTPPAFAATRLDDHGFRLSPPKLGDADGDADWLLVLSACDTAVFPDG